MKKNKSKPKTNSKKLKNEIVIPEIWNEIDEKHFIAILNNAMLVLMGEISEFDFRTKLLSRYLNEKISFKDSFRPTSKIENRRAQLYRLQEKLTNFFKDELIEEKPVRVMNYMSTRNFLPVIKVGRKKLYGPKDSFLDLKFGEFRACVKAFKRYQESKDVEPLEQLFFYLYRPLVKGEREEFNISTCADRLHTYANVPYTYLYATYLYFGTCQHFTQNGTIELEGNEIDLGSLFKKATENEDDIAPNLGLTGLLYRLADEGTFGNIEQTDKAGYYDVLLKMYQWKLDADAAKKRSS